MSDDAKLSTRRRLEEIEQELTDLRAQRADLRAQWETEKFHIQTLRGLKSDIEAIKLEAADAERAGEYGRVAELRYGTLHELERRLAEANQQMIDLQQGTNLLKEEIDGEE